MAIKIEQPVRRKLSIMGLIDVIFILLIFFVILNVIVHESELEGSTLLPVPENRPGQAQVLVQISEKGGYLYLDDDVFKSIHAPVAGTPQWRRRSPTERSNYFATSIRRKPLLGREELRNTLRAKIRKSQRDTLACNILVRCPGDMPYGHVVEILGVINGITEGDRGTRIMTKGGTHEELVEDAFYAFENNVMSVTWEGGR